MYPILHELADVIERVARGRCGGIEHTRLPDVEVVGRRLEMEKGSVESPEALHGLLPSRALSSARRVAPGLSF